jgi:hypothetical protein
MEGHEVFVLDRALQPAPFGAVGELCIGGVGLAREYLGDPGRTARVFVPHPWRVGERLYRTGDLGRLAPDGTLQYRGRRDHQVKIRGVRIELGEVEAAIRTFPGLADTVVTTWQPAPGDKRLAAYVVFEGRSPREDSSEAGRVSALRSHLTDRLASAAVPSAITVLAALPRNPSGKLDRRSLPVPEPPSASESLTAPPATDAELAVAAIWAEVLGLPRIGADDDFFALGGHSLLVTRAVNRMREAFAADVPIRLVFEHSTVRAAAQRIEQLILAEIGAMSDEDVERLNAAVADASHGHL